MTNEWMKTDAPKNLPIFFNQVREFVDRLEINLNDENPNIREKTIVISMIFLQFYIEFLDEAHQLISEDKEGKPH